MRLFLFWLYISYFFLLFLFGEIHSQTISSENSFVLDSTKNETINLPWSEKEIEQCSKIVHGKKFLFLNACEENFKQHAPNSKIIHLATHAYINDQNPMYSKFVFNKSNNSFEDGQLHIFELYNMNLNSQLAVLSACNTGAGKLVKGEGIISLARGFRYAGCPNLVMSLWQVDDKSTSIIMKYFYENLARGTGKSESLRKAKLKYLSTADEIKSHPYYWAGFVLLGDDAPVNLNRRIIPPFLKSILLFSIVLSVSILIIYKFFKKKLSGKNLFKLNLFIFLIIIIISSNLLFFFYCKQNKQLPPLKTNSIQTNSFLVAEKLLQQAYYDSSIYCFKKASQKFLSQQNWEKYLRCQNGIAENFLLKSEYDSAAKIINSAINFGIENFNQNNLELSNCYKHLGTLNRKRGNPHTALTNYEKALSFLSNKNKTHQIQIADIFLNISVAYYYIGDFEKAFQYNDSSYTIRKKVIGETHPETAKNLNIFGLLSSEKGEQKKALNYYKKSLSIRENNLRKDHPDLAKNYLNIGVIFCQKGDFENALDFYEKALEIKLKNSNGKSISIAGSYLNLGVVSDNQGSHQDALDYYFQALSIMKALGAKNHILMGDLYNNIGITYKNLEEYETALEYYQKSLFFYLNVSGENHPKIPNLYLNLGILYSIQNKHLKSINNFNKSLTLGKKIFHETNPHFSITYLNMGIEYLRNKNLQRAHDCFQQTLNKGKKIFGTHHPIISEALQGMGQFYLLQNKINKALQSFQKAIAALTLDFKSKNIYDNPKIENIRDELRLLNALSSKAEALERRFDYDRKSINDLIHAIKTYELAINLINQISTGYNAESAKLLLGENTHLIFNKAIKLALRIYEQTSEKKYKELAFMFSEKSKSSILRAILLDSKAKKFANIPDSLLRKEHRVKIDIGFAKKQLFEMMNNDRLANSSKIDLLQNKLFSLNRSRAALIKTFEQNYPEYYSLKYQNEIKSSMFIQEKLRGKNSTVVEYFLGDSSLYIFTISEKKFDIVKVKIDSLFKNQVINMRVGLMKRDYALYTSNAYELYQQLIQLVEQKIANKILIIIPDGILGYISFEALLKEKAGKTNFQSLHYLINDFQISYSFSASLLFESHSNETAWVKNNFVGFAPVTFE